jgi:hypothetical protein
VKDVCEFDRTLPNSCSDRLPRQALDYADRVKDTKPHLACIFSATRGIVFLGTPHRGSGMTSLPKLVALVVQAALQNANDSLIRDLERDSQTLDRMREGFSQILHRRTFVIWSFVEELPVAGIGKVYPAYAQREVTSYLILVEQVVDGESAIIGDPYENRGTIYGDHFGMAKFSSRGDSEYRKVLYAIEMLLELPGTQSMSTNLISTVNELLNHSL